MLSGLAAMGLKVARLIRAQFGHFYLGQLEPGEIAGIPAKLWREPLEIKSEGGKR